jgi:hypothetical protein
MLLTLPSFGSCQTHPSPVLFISSTNFCAQFPDFKSVLKILTYVVEPNPGITPDRSLLSYSDFCQPADNSKQVAGRLGQTSPFVPFTEDAPSPL